MTIDDNREVGLPARATNIEITSGRHHQGNKQSFPMPVMSLGASESQDKTVHQPRLGWSMTTQLVLLINIPFEVLSIHTADGASTISTGNRVSEMLCQIRRLLIVADNMDCNELALKEPRRMTRRETHVMERTRN